MVIENPATIEDALEAIQAQRMAAFDATMRSECGAMRERGWPEDEIAEARQQARDCFDHELQIALATLATELATVLPSRRWN